MTCGRHAGANERIIPLLILPFLLMNLHAGSELLRNKKKRDRDSAQRFLCACGINLLTYIHTHKHRDSIYYYRERGRGSAMQYDVWSIKGLVPNYQATTGRMSYLFPGYFQFSIFGAPFSQCFL